MDMTSNFFNPGPFMPHGGCYLWTQSLIALNAISDGLIVLAYYSIPFLLLYFVRKRKDLKFHGVFVCFALFVLACGTTHLMEIWNIWHANYWLSGSIKAVTALVSVPTAILFFKLLPQALALPSADELQKARDELEVRVRERTAELLETTGRLKAEIAERKQAEAALAGERMLLGTLVEHLPVAVYLKDAAGRKTLSNPADIRLCGVASEADILGKTDTELFRREQAAVFQADEKQVINTGQPMLNREEQLTGSDGSIRWLLTSKVPLIDAVGRVTGLAGIGLDITERKRAEESLKLFRTLLDHSNETIEVLDPKTGRFLDVNERGCLDSGYSREEYLARQVFDLDAMLTPAGFADSVAAVRKSGRLTWLGIHQRKDGSTFPVEINLAYVRLDRDYLIAMVRDITERKQAEESHARLATAVEQAAEIIVITDIKGTIQYVNPAFEKTTGYTCAEALGKNSRILKSGQHEGEFYRQMWDVLQRGEIWHGHIINKRKDGKLYEEEATISPLRDAAGNVINYVGVKRDVTREVQLEAQFRQAQKLEAIGTLASGVAHDFNNILAIIQMQTSLLKSGGGLSAEQEKFADEIAATVDRAAALTRQLLLFSRKETLQPHDLDLSQSIANMTRMLQRILGEAIAVQLNLAAQPVFIHADAGMMDQVLLNLTVNAHDAMPHGGRLIITTAAVEFDEFAVAQSAQARPGSFVCLSVADTGCGIPPEILPRIFEPFFTTKGVGKGTGLGLATVFGIVQQHHGWINVYSEVGSGTTFKVYLPRLSGMNDELIAKKMLAAKPTGHETILLVEDEPSLRTSVQMALTRLGYRVLEAPTGAKALDIWKEHGGEIRLLLTDLMIPGGMTGNDLAQRLLQDNPQLKVIYMSGYSAEVAGNGLPMKEGVNFLTKPFQAHQLAQTIRDSLEKPA
jgi:PAS domain S-box-containing protein